MSKVDWGLASLPQGEMTAHLAPGKLNTEMDDAWLVTADSIMAIIEADIAKARAETQRCVSRMDSLNQELSHWEATVASYRKRHNLSRISLSDEQKHCLRGETLAAQARMLAGWNGGLLVMKDAVKALVESHLLQGDYPDSAFYTAVNRDESFERERRGIYRLVQAPASSPRSGAAEAGDGAEKEL